MRAVFVHLSGSLRGDTQKFEKKSISIGCDPASDIRFDAGVDEATSDRQAEVFFDDCEYYLRDLGSAKGTFVNGHKIEEVILKDGDVIEFGKRGPKVRFHVEKSKGEVCKPFRTVYRDSVRRSRRFHRPGVKTAVGFFREFSRALYRESTPAIRWIYLSSLMLIGLSLVLSAFVFIQSSLSKRSLEKEIVQLRKQLTTDRMSREALEREIAAERQRNIESNAQHRAETGARLAALQKEEETLSLQLQQAQSDVSMKAEELASLRSKLAATSRQISVIERDRSLAERIIKQYQAGVCFIEGAYRFYDASGSPLRFLALDSGGAPLKDSSGQTLYTTSGNAPIVQVNYSGTGFLISKSGLIVTNRHVADPAWDDEEVKALAKKGFVLRFEYFRAFFPGIEAPFKLDAVKVSDKADVALVKADVGKNKIPVLEIEGSSTTMALGQRVILLGYPTGLDALLARLDEKVVDSVVSTIGTDPGKISLELSRRGMIRPLSTQGHLSDILPYKLVYDAQTTHGGSGGPLFNSRGRVIGVNFAILSDFSGANFGVPIQFVVELLRSKP